MRVKSLLKGVSVLLGGASIMVICVYAVNFLFLTRFLPEVSIYDIAFIEGLLFLLIGFLFLLGSGGINPATLKALFLASAADALCDDEYAPSEILRRDVWKPRGFQRFALILIFSGVILVISYFVFRS